LHRMCRTLFRTAILASKLNRARARRGPRELALTVRRLGRTAPRRSQVERAKLRRIIRLVDSLFPSGPNCYRRALVEMAMDAGAAAEPLHMGLKAAGGRNSGHAWLASERDTTERYDAEFVV
jgi:hypothetical protein